MPNPSSSSETSSHGTTTAEELQVPGVDNATMDLWWQTQDILNQLFPGWLEKMRAAFRSLLDPSDDKNSPR